jgi:DNA-binding SARP family transcriptional activator
VDYRILGRLTVVADTELPLGGPRQRGILALLLLRAGQVVATDRLAEELWHGRPPRGAQITLRSYISRLRSTLVPAAGRPVLVTQAPGYLLDVGPADVDAARFEALVRDGQAALAAARPGAAADLLRTALALWRGPVLEDLGDLALVRTERARLDGLRLAAVESRMEADLALGRHAEIISELEAMLAEHPLRESLHGLRMLALYRCGRQAEALAAYRSARTVLAEELGIEPGTALRRRHEAILRQEPSLEPAADVTVTASAVRRRDSAAPPGRAEPFVGRDEELAQFRGALEDARAGRGNVLLLVGEPGIGKSRMIQEFGAEARAVGFDVLCGRAWEEQGAPPFWPWVQALRAWVERLEPSILRTACGSEASVLGQLVPAVAERLPGLARSPELAPAYARFRLFDAVTRLLCRAAAERPLLLALDDLHRADAASLRLLQFLAREVAGARLLIVGAYRDLDKEHEVVFRDVLAELWREPGTLHLRLAGLRRPEIAQYVELVSGQRTAEPLVGALQARTGGNAFFLRELVRLLLAEGGLDQFEQLGGRIPHGVQAAVERRLEALPAEQARATLALAAVIGRVFCVNALSAAGDAPAELLLGHLDQACAVGLVTELPDEPGRYRFTHALIRDALYAGLSGARKARLHLRVGEALEYLHGADPDLHLAELAHHFRQSRRPEVRRRAASYAARAGERALTVYAYEEAIQQFRLALDDTADGDSRSHDDLLLSLADAQVRAGDVAAGRQTCHRAAALARERGRPIQLARAGVLLYDDPMEFGTFNPELVALLEQALTGLGDEEPALRAKVLARLAMALSWQPADDPDVLGALAGRCQVLARRAVVLARGLGDPAVLAYALGADNHVHSGPEYAERRLEVADEILRLAGPPGDRTWELQARRWRVITYAELGRFTEFDTEVAAYAVTAEELRMPDYLVWVPLWQGMRAVMAGDVEQAERLAAQARAGAPDPPAPAVIQGYGAALWTLHRERGRLGMLEPTLAGLVKRFPARPGWRAALALTLAAAGRVDEARRQLDRLAWAGFRDVPRDRGWLITMTRLAEACALLREADHAGRLYELLLPFERRCAVAFGVATTGPVAFHLGRLAEVLGREPEAHRHYALAVEISRRFGAPSWLAQARHRLASPPAPVVADA